MARIYERIDIGKDVTVASRVSIRDDVYTFEDKTEPMILQGIKTATMIIEDNV